MLLMLWKVKYVDHVNVNIIMKLIQIQERDSVNKIIGVVFIKLVQNVMIVKEVFF